MAKKIKQNELPELLKKYNIRVSTPYGAYPEDVVNILLKLDNEISGFKSDNKLLTKENEQLKYELNKAKAQITSLKLSISQLEIGIIPDNIDTDIIKQKKPNKLKFKGGKE